MNLAAKISRRASLLGALLGGASAAGASAASAAPAVPALRGGHPLHVSGGPPLTVRDGSTTVYPTTTLTLSGGATVTNGGAGEALVAVSGGSSGLVLIGDPISITSPVPYYDLVLPSGYLIPFIFRFSGVFFNVTDGLVAAVSTDAGVSFINNATDYDSYLYLGETARTDGSSGFNPGNTDSLMMSAGGAQEPSAPLGLDLYMEIYPGSNSELGRIFFRKMSHAPTTSTKHYFTQNSEMINPDATITPTPGRWNLLRFQAYGSGNVASPAPDTNIIAGVGTLWGAPIP